MSEARRRAGRFRALLCLAFLATPAAAQTVCPTTINGALTASSPTQSGQRLFRDAVAATCGRSKTNPGTIAPSGSRPYAVYRFTNSLSSAACYTFTVTTTSGTVQEVAYTSYDPSNAAANYLADSGNSSALETMSLTAAGGASFDVVVVGVAMAANATYALDVAGCTAEPSVALAIAGPNPSVFGQKAYFRAFVTGIGAPPTGTVGFMDGATNLGTVAIDSSGNALLGVSSLVVGTHSFTAAYSGDLNYAARTSLPVLQVVDPASTTTILRSMRHPPSVGQPSVLVATVQAAAPSEGTPSGTVEFGGNGPLGTVTLAAGRATVSANLGFGDYTLYATYAGDGNFTTSTGYYHYFTVDELVTLTATPSMATYGTPVRLDVAVSAGTGGTPTGTVTFTADETVTLGVVDVSSSPVSLTISTLAVGTHGVLAEYSGDATHNPGWMRVVQTVEAAPTTTVLASTVNPSAAGQAVTFTATVSGTVGTPTGMVAIHDGAVMVGSATLDSGGRATFTTSSLAVGTHPLTIAYAGDAHYASSTSSVLSQQVDKSSTTVGLASSQNPQQLGAAVTFIATASAALSGTSTPAGNVSFYDDTGTRTLLGSAALTGGQAMLDVSTLTLGTHVITADYAGDTSFNPGSSPSLSQNIAAAVSAVTLAATPSPSRFGDSVQVQASVAAGTGGTATGTIAFSDGEAALGTAALNGSGSALMNVTTLSVGGHTISAAYGGDSNHNAATASATHRVSKAPTTTAMTSSANPSRVGQPVTLNATVSSPAAIPQGTVLFREGTATLGTATLDASGVAHLDVPHLSVGDHLITVSYPGSATLNPSSTAEPTQVVSKAETRILLTSSSNPVGRFADLTLTATAQAVAPGSGVPTGEVVLMDGMTPLWSAPLNAGTFSFEMGGQLSGGIHDLTLEYPGDANFSSGKSAVLQQTVLKADGVTVTVNAFARSYGLLTALYTTVQAPLLSATGTVTFTEGGTKLGIVGIDVNGGANWFINSLDAGTHSVTVTYDGDEKYLPASTIVEFVIPQRATGLSLSSNTSSPVAGEPFTLRAALSRARTVAIENAPQGPLPPVIGNVTFRDGQTVLGIVPIPNGSTTLTVSLLAIGRHDLSARYEGSNNYGPSEGNLTLDVIMGGAVDGGPPEGGTPEAGEDGGYDAPSVLDGGSSMPETGPTDVGAIDAPVRDGATGDVMQSDAADAARDAADAAGADGRNADAAADGSPALPPAVPDAVTTGQGGCGCYVAARSSGTRELWAVGFALGFVAIRRRNRRGGTTTSC